MSQLPTDQLGRGQLATAARANRASGTPRQQIGSLNAPGVVAKPPDTGPSAYRTIAAAFGVAGQVAQTVEDYTDRRIAFVRGEAARHVADALPTLLGEIEAGNIKAPASLEDIDGVVDPILGEAIGDDKSKAYTDEYRSRMRPALISALTQRHLRDQKENDAVLAAANLDGVAFKTSPDELRDASLALQEHLYFEMPKEQADSMVGLHAARVASEAGDAAAFEAAAQFLGDRETLAMTQYRNKLELRQRQNQQAAVQARADAVENELAALYNASEPTEENPLGTPIPAEQARQIIIDGAVSPEHARSMFDDLKRRVKAQFDGAIRGIADRQVGEVHSNLLERITKQMADPNRPASMLSVAGEEHTFTDALGREHTFTTEELMDEAVTREMRRLAETLPPEEAFAAQADFIENSDTTNPAWVADIQAGYTSAAFDWATILDNGEGGIPPRLQNAYNLYKRLGARSPRLRDQHVKTEGPRAMFEIAELAERYGYDAPSAMLMAVRALSPRGPFNSPEQWRIAGKDVEKATESARSTGHLWWTDEAKNDADLYGAIQQRARFYVASLGINPEAAVEEAGKWVRDHQTIINGWSIDTTNRQIPKGIEQLVEHITTEYASAYEDVRAGDLTLIPWETPNQWVLFNTATGMPVENWQQEGMYSTAGLERIAEGIRRFGRDGIVDQVTADAEQAQAVRARQAEGRYTIGELIVEGGKRAPGEWFDVVFGTTSTIPNAVLPESVGGINTQLPTSTDEYIEMTKNDIRVLQRDFDTWWDDFKLGADVVREGAATATSNVDYVLRRFFPNPQGVRDILNTEVDISE